MSGTELRKPAPADFAQWASTEGWNALRTRYGTSTPTLQRWIAETGIVRPSLVGGRLKRDIPADFASMSAKHTNVELMAIYSCGSSTIARWRKESGAERRDKMQVPADFAVVWRTKSIIQLAAHYGRNHSTISAWIKRLGLSRPRGRTLTQQVRRPVASAKPKAVEFSRAAPPKRFIKPDAFRTAAVDRVQRDMSDAGRAADTLRRDRWTVFRCDVSGKANPDGTHWLCGRIVCTSAELIERAERAAQRMAA